MNTYKQVPDNKVAISLEYDGDSAPRVSAKGSGLIGEQIIQLAYENDIAVHEDPALVQALSLIDTGDEIPDNLYLAVAEILAFIYYLDEKDNPL